MDLTALIDAGALTAAGINVSPDRALRCMPAYAGVRAISETIGSLPVHIYKRRKDGGKDRADHPLSRLLHDRPNGWTSAAEFIMALTKDAVTHGGGFAFANRAGDKIVELIRLQPSSVTVEIDASSREPRYRVALQDGGTKVYPWRDILHVAALGGLSPIKQASEAIGLYMVMEQHAAKLFGNGARPSGLLKSKTKISDPVLARLKTSWQGAHGGGANSGGTAILEEGIDFQSLTFNSVDLQFQELRAFQVLEIARALRVPPTLLMDFGRATWANAAEMGQSFLTYGILPWLKIWQGAIARLMSEKDQADHFAEFLVDDLVKADIAARFTAYSQAVTNGILNPNEVRAMENRAPYEGGNEFRLPLNTETPTPTERPKPRAVA